MHEFHDVIKSYPHEWELIQDCVEEFSPALDLLVHDYMDKHQNVIYI